MPNTTTTPLLVNQVGEQFGLTVSNTTVSLTVPAGPPVAAYATIQVETNSIRITERPSGTAVSTTVGTLISAGQTFVSYTPGAVRMIRNGASDASVNVAYYD